MKKLFLLVVVLTALTVFCSAAIAQYGYAVPTLETVRKDGYTANVYTYRDGNGKTIRTIEYYVNDDGSYGNRDVYYGNNGVHFRVQTDYKNGVCTVAEQSTSYSENDLATVNTRETTFNPDGNVNVLTYTLQELGNENKVVNGMETDGQGRKICDFKEEYYKDAQNNQASRRTVYNPNKTVEVIHTTEKQDGSEIRNEWIYDENGKTLYSLYVDQDANGKEVHNEAVKYTYGENGLVTAETLIVDGETDTQLSYIEKWQEDETSSTATGELQDKKGNKLADYSFEKTWGKNEPEVTVATFIYPDGRVDIITKTEGVDGTLSIQKQLDFKAYGEKAEETPDDDFEYENFFNWDQDESAEADEELIRYFEEISDIWAEEIDEDAEIGDAVPADSDGKFAETGDETGDSEDWSDETGDPEDWSDDYADPENWDAADDDSEDWDGDDGGSDSWIADSGSSSSWTGDSGSSSSWSGDTGSSSSWSGDSGSSSNSSGDSGGSSDSAGDSGGSDDWSGDDGGSEDWDGDDDGFGD